MTSVDSRQFRCKVVGKHGRVEWVAERHCASDGSHYQGYKCLDCGEKFGDKTTDLMFSASLELKTTEGK